MMALPMGIMADTMGAASLFIVQGFLVAGFLVLLAFANRRHTFSSPPTPEPPPAHDPTEANADDLAAPGPAADPAATHAADELGRASCRERGWQSVSIHV